MRFLAVSCSCITVARALSQRTTITSSRAHFLSSAAATFTGVSVLAMEPAECDAATKASNVGSGNPRYIDKNLEMKYGEGPGV